MTTSTLPQRQFKDYKSDNEPIWCPGCGDFGVLNALYKAMAKQNLNPDDILVVSGIGCSSRLPGFVKTYGFHTIHGRTLPIALGAKVGNPDLHVVVVGGDGDAFSIGAGHIPHMARRNADVLYIVMDNEIYGLTKGQFSPTSPTGLHTGSSPYGSVEMPLNPILMMLSYNASFVARAYSSQPNVLADLIVEGMQHKGFSFIDVISPCVTFYNTYPMIPTKIAPIDPAHDVTNLKEAFNLALDPEKIRLGVFYKKERTSYETAMKIEQEMAMAGATPNVNDLIERFK